MAKGLLSDPGKKQKNQKQQQRQEQRQAKQDAKAQKQFQRTTAEQQRNIVQGQGQSLQDMTNLGNSQFKQVQDSYSTPFDLSGLPAAPVADENYRQQIEKANLDRFNREYDQQFADELSDFEQMAGNRGWTPGSEVYNKEKTRIQNAQNKARENAVDQARISGGAEMNRYYDLQDRTRGTARDEYIASRDRPFQEYSATQNQAASNPLWNQWSQGSQQQFQGQQNQLDRNQQMKLTQMSLAKAGGGGGGGGGSDYGGFGSQQAYWDAQDARNRANMEYELQLKQKYNPQPKQVSPWAQLGGGILNAGLQGWASGGFKF